MFHVFLHLDKIWIVSVQNVTLRNKFLMFCLTTQTSINKLYKCVVPYKIHIHPKEIPKGGGGGGTKVQKSKSTKYVPQLKFPEGLGVGGEGSKPQNPPWEGYGYFLEHHHLKQVN